MANNFTPLSEVHLVQLELDIDNKNQLTFASASAQNSFFSGISNKLDYTNLTYIRKDHYIVVPTNVDNIYKYNYLYYKNTDTSSKWYYAFIVKAEWLSENSSRVYIKTDVWQTYQFDIDFKTSFVEREMINVSDDIRGANLEPEDLEIGETIVDGTIDVSGLGMVYVIACGKNPADIPNQSIGTQTLNGCTFNDLASGIWYYIGNYGKVLEKILELSTLGFANDIKAVFSVPSVAVYGFDSLSEDPYTLSELDNPDTYWGSWLVGNILPSGVEFTVDCNITTLNGYTPRNKKLLQYPYCYLGFNPLNGSEKVIRYEDCKLVTNSTNTKFKMISEINPNPNVLILPDGYKNDAGLNIFEALSLSGYPNISYQTDFFSNWLAQNSELTRIDWNRQDLNYDLSMAKQITGYAGNIAGAVGNIASGNVGQGIGQAITSSGDVVLNTYGLSKNYDLDIQQRQAQITKTSMLPNNASIGTSATLFEYGLNKYNVFRRYCIKQFFAERIDQYFDMFGYKTNKLKIPNLNNRPNWNYVKTLGVIIKSKTSTSQVDHTVLQEDMQELKSLFDNGITLWHKTSTFLDYSQDNRTFPTP